ncbi:MAG: hypothetical protein ACOCWJ_06390, partial [Verrucomicrobiota bacterium]
MEDWASALKVTRLSHALVPAYADGQLRRWIVTNPAAASACDRQVTFWLMWDDNAVYLAGRSRVPEGRELTRRWRPVHSWPPLFHDDAYEFAVDASDVEPDNEDAKGVRMCLFNPFGLEQVRTLPPDFQPYGKMPVAELDIDAASKVWKDGDGST